MVKQWGPGQFLNFFDTKYPRLLRKLTSLLTDSAYTRWGTASISAESLEQLCNLFKAKAQRKVSDQCAMLDAITMCLLFDLYAIYTSPSEKKKRQRVTKGLSSLCDVLSGSNDPHINEHKRKLKEIRDIYSGENQNCKYLTKSIPDIYKSGIIPEKVPPNETSFALVAMTCLAHVSIYILHLANTIHILNIISHMIVS